jgi:UDP-N-acetylglucosamine transferase subunit ALG13
VHDPQPGRHLLVASTGGHLAQLAKWSKIIGSSHDSLWVTFKSPQSESLLVNRRVLYVPYVAPRDISGTVKAFLTMMKQIDWNAEIFTSAITTGAAVGLAGLAAARLHRVPRFYFESVSRVNGPSLTGRIVSLDRSIQASCQYEHWSGGRWHYRGSLFDDFKPVVKRRNEHPSLFVTLGTIKPYRFDAVIDSVLSTGLADDRTVWQLGATTRRLLPGKAVSQMCGSEFVREARAADVVVTHAGVGTIMHLVEMGIYPVVVPRRAKRREHVDDHQVQIAHLLQSRAISMVAEADELRADDIIEASAFAIRIQEESEL